VLACGIGREHGPLAFRIIIQPSVVAILAIRAGLQDARSGRPAYGTTITSDALHRRELIWQGWKDVGRLFGAAVVIDLAYEMIVFGWLYPGQALIVAATLALPAYFLIRGLTNRLVRRWVQDKRHTGRSTY
jgi:hypothetical protein